MHCVRRESWTAKTQSESVVECRAQSAEALIAASSDTQQQQRETESDSLGTELVAVAVERRATSLSHFRFSLLVRHSLEALAVPSFI